MLMLIGAFTMLHNLWIKVDDLHTGDRRLENIHCDLLQKLCIHCLARLVNKPLGFTETPVVSGECTTLDRHSFVALLMASGCI